MKSVPKALILNGIYHSSIELRAVAVELQAFGKSEWEQALGKFLQQWLDEKDTIEVRTSGSTGTPKLTTISKRSMLSSASMTGSFLGFRQGQTALLCLNTGFIAGMMMVVRAMVFQMNLITVPPFGSPLNKIRKGSIDFAAMVPAQVYNSLMDKVSGQVFGSIGTIIVGGAALSHELEKMIGQLNGRIYATFGMTETITHIALRRLNGPDRTDIYTVLPGITIECDARGCLVAGVPYVDGTKIVTNDLVTIESPVCFRWLGRADNVINTGGVKLIPETIEKKIAEFVRHRFFITCLPDPKLGEIPVLVVESDITLTDQYIEDILLQIKPFLSQMEMPRRILHSVKFSETGNGKINRRESLKNIRKI
ncbi:MAG: AMP-binding protein [Bacteroidota bacterium]